LWKSSSWSVLQPYSCFISKALSIPFLSIIIPAYNEERRLPRTLEQIFSYLEEQAYDFEVLIVENGSSDRTYAVAQEYAEKYPNLQVIREQQPGKGNAVRRGMLAAQGSFRFMCDADLSMPIEELNKFLPDALGDFDLAIASREIKGAVRYHEPYYRHLGGRLINLAMRILILPGLQDTQCGFKCFRNQVAEDIFRYQTIPGWSFDIELLYIARKRGYRIHEIPIHWYFDADTKLRAVKDAFHMLRDIFLIYLNNVRGRYDPQV
jgi:dolichyl-phosphate beta-glucosyltransferase